MNTAITSKENKTDLLTTVEETCKPFLTSKKGYWEHAITALKKIDDTHKMAQAIYELGETSSRKGHYEAAIFYYFLSLQFADAIPLKDDEINRFIGTTGLYIIAFYSKYTLDKDIPLNIDFLATTNTKMLIAFQAIRDKTEKDLKCIDVCKEKFPIITRQAKAPKQPSDPERALKSFSKEIEIKIENISLAAIDKAREAIENLRTEIKQHIDRLTNLTEAEKQNFDETQKEKLKNYDTKREKYIKLLAETSLTATEENYKLLSPVYQRLLLLQKPDQAIVKKYKSDRAKLLNTLTQQQKNLQEANQELIRLFKILFNPQKTVSAISTQAAPESISDETHSKTCPEDKSSSDTSIVDSNATDPINPSAPHDNIDITSKSDSSSKYVTLISCKESTTVKTGGKKKHKSRRSPRLESADIASDSSELNETEQTIVPLIAEINLHMQNLDELTKLATTPIQPLTNQIKLERYNTDRNSYLTLLKNNPSASNLKQTRDKLESLWNDLKSTAEKLKNKAQLPSPHVSSSDAKAESKSTFFAPPNNLPHDPSSSFFAKMPWDKGSTDRSPLFKPMPN